MVGISAERDRVNGLRRVGRRAEAGQSVVPVGALLSERQWGTVREDYSESGEAWGYLPHEQARSRAYRWGEDGLAGFCDVEQRLCLGLALWNGRDPILKERMFGLTGAEGNHGEDVKEYWWYLDALPSHAWNRWRYHYPQAAFPYHDLVARERTAQQVRTGVRAARHRSLRRGPLLDHRGLVRQGRAHRRADDRRGHQRGPGGRHAARAADRLVPQHLVLGPGGGQTDAGGRPVGRPVADGASFPAARWSSLAGPDPTGRAASCCSARTRRTRRGCSAALRRLRTPRTGSTTTSSHGADTVNPERTGSKCAFWYQVTVEPGPDRAGTGADASGPPDRVSPAVDSPPPWTATSSGSSSSVAPRPTSSTPS